MTTLLLLLHKVVCLIVIRKDSKKMIRYRCQTDARL